MDTNRCMRSGLIWIMCYLLFGRYNLLGLKGSKKWWWILYVYVWLSGWTVHFQIMCIFGLNLILDINHFAMHWLFKVLFFFKKGAPLPCRFDAYDLNGNKAISVEEFLSATKGFTKMDRKILFERLDRNGQISMQ